MWYAFCNFILSKKLSGGKHTRAIDGWAGLKL